MLYYSRFFGIYHKIYFPKASIWDRKIPLNMLCYNNLNNLQNIIANKLYLLDKITNSVYKILHYSVKIFRKNSLHIFSVIC